MALLRDGFKTLIGFQLLPGAGGTDYHEVELALPEIDGRGGIDQTSMRNTVYTTEIPKYLVTFGEFRGTFMYSAAFYVGLTGLLNRNQLLSIQLPDGTVLQFWGWVSKATPSSLKEGERPTLDVTFRVSNLNSSCQETAPAVVYGSGNPCFR